MQNLSEGLDTDILAIKPNNETIENSDEFFLLFLDKSQLVITFIGLVANVGTSLTLIKNGQVSKNSKNKR